MKKLIFSIIILASTYSFAAAEATYECENYRVELQGADTTRVYDTSGNLVKEAITDEESPLVATSSGETMLLLDKVVYTCKMVSEEQ